MRNRTHYVSRESKALVPEQELTTAVQNNFNVAILNNADLDALQTLFSSGDDTTFDVVFDGTSYPCKWLEQGGNRIPVFGNFAIVQEGSTDTGEPFVFSAKLFGDDIAIAIACKVAGTHTVAVSYQQDVVHTLDPKYIGHIDPALFANVDSDNDTFAIPFTKEFAADKWAEDYSYFEDSWLSHHFNADITLEVNGTRFEHLPFSAGSYGRFTYGDVNAIGVAIVNSGYGTSTQRVKVSATLYPNGIKSARVFRSGAYRIDEEMLPESAYWVTMCQKTDFLTQDDASKVNGLSYFGVEDVLTDLSRLNIYSTKRLLAVESKYLTPEVILFDDTGHTSDATMTLNNGDTVTQDMIPDKIALVAVTKNKEVVLLNPVDLR